MKAVFPVRGGIAGGTLLKIYGRNFGTGPVVQMGGNNCPVVSGTATTTYIECTIPVGTLGLVDVNVTSGAASYLFEKGYRYITGFEV